MKRLNLREEFADLHQFVAERLRSFDPVINDGPGKGTRVGRIDLGYQFDQAGWVAFVFDTRTKAEPDGSWNAHIAGNSLPRPRWQALAEANEEHSIRVTLTDGTSRVIEAGDADELAQVLGNLLRDVLLKARSDGLFASLPKSQRCELGVEEHDGAYGWPTQEERGLDNLA